MPSQYLIYPLREPETDLPILCLPSGGVVSFVPGAKSPTSLVIFLKKPKGHGTCRTMAPRRRPQVPGAAALR
jgi:hypothetical protein